MITLSAVKSLDDIPETIRPLFAFENDTLTLDDSRIKTQKDIDNILEAKKKEVSDHNLTKAELAKYRRINASAEELEKRLQELEASSGTAGEQTERLKKALQDFKAKEREAAALSEELAKIRPEYEQMKVAQTKARIAQLVDEELKGHKEVDAERTRRVLMKDVATGFIGLDETGTVLALKDGAKLGDYIDQTAKDFGFVATSVPGSTFGNPNIDHRAPQMQRKQFSVSDESFLDDETLRQARL